MGRGRKLKKFKNIELMPDLLIIGGVNGAGKSTIFPSIQNTEHVEGSFQPGKIENENFVNADDIERSMGGGQISAARNAITQLYEKIDQGINVAIESTVWGKGFIYNAIKKAKQKGYRIYIVYVILYSPELSMARVVQRALLGKHYIPMHQILERYSKSVNNFFNLYKQEADFWVVINNSKLIPSVLCWGGMIYGDNRVFRQSEESFKHLLEILKFNGIEYSFDQFDREEFSPFVFGKIIKQVENELKKRPAGTTVVYQENGKMLFEKL